MFIYLKVLLLAPLFIALIFHSANIIYIIYKFYERNFSNINFSNTKFSNINFSKIIEISLVGYIITFSISVLIAFFDGFYEELNNVNDRQSAILYILYLNTFILIYSIQYIILKISEIYLLSSKTFKIVIYIIVFVISFLTYGIAPITNLNDFQKHISIWNNTLTTLIIFEALFFLIFTKQND